jgi:hypothetical protein
MDRRHVVGRRPARPEGVGCRRRRRQWPELPRGEGGGVAGLRRGRGVAGLMAPWDKGAVRDAL